MCRGRVVHGSPTVGNTTDDAEGFDPRRRVVALTDFSIFDVLDVGSRIRALATGAASMEEVARDIVGLVGDEICDADGASSSVLVRCFVTGACDRIPEPLALQLSPADRDGGPCLTLLATDGVEPEWRDRRLSRRHQVIPIAGSDVVERFPMFTQMYRQFRFPLPVDVRPTPGGVVDPNEHTYGVFHVADARANRAIPDQQFVDDYGVSSVVAIGGRLPTGQVFTLIVFSRESIDRRVAELLQLLAISMRLAFLPVLGRVFASDSRDEPLTLSTEVLLRVEVESLRTLLELQDSLVLDDPRRASRDPDASGLTSRELDVVELLATGATNRQIALELAVSSGTVKWHIYNVFRKLDVETRTEAVSAARRRGLVR